MPAPLMVTTSLWQYGRMEIAAVSALGLVVPCVMIVVFAALWSRENFVRWEWIIYLPILGGVLLAVFISRYAPRAISLGSEVIERRWILGKEAIATAHVNRILKIRKGNREVYVLATRGGQGIAFGPGLSHTDFESAGRWVRDLAEALGIRYRGDLTILEAQQILTR